ncbi:endonuclease/exonuclease/phosphatase family protein [Sphingobacterium psychroaquaticum]|uniref:Endonuclease/Exonuclease/phosphatase family protein n=1 Tax=Sphingobacterium psychroaquaticum TaxID=561061 RepID=A0A1X7HWK3_9SPHI|nr:endonuclease/exonuclease/phosphatase family protein [Sphingobacterium psychroaquaticum]SMG05961.1 Endonuclease/Exonuclease/phosphatase family protein [Sphingobacterium psychroaquaticum]
MIRIIGLFLVFLGGLVSTAQARTTLKVLQINIWQEGTVVPGGFSAIVDEIIAKKPDAVLFSEVRNYEGTDFIQRIRAELKSRGVSYYSESSEAALDVGFISIYPIIQQESLYTKENKVGNVLKSKIEVGGRTFAFYSLHLDYTNYACYLPRGYDGVTWKKMEQPITDAFAISTANRKGKRDEAIRDVITDINKEDQSQSFIVGGDFNEPSHLDWTDKTKHLFDHGGAVVPWDCSVLLQEAGFSDSFRVKYPNPVSHPGFTFPSFNKDVPLNKLTWAPTADERDRIDYVYFKSKKPMKVAEVRIVGPVETVKNGQLQDRDSRDKFLVPENVWPTDHKALLVTFVF